MQAVGVQQMIVCWRLGWTMRGTTCTASLVSLVDLLHAARYVRLSLPVASFPWGTLRVTSSMVIRAAPQCQVMFLGALVSDI